MPARERRAVADEVLGRPQDSAVVDVAGYVVVGADDVEIARRHRCEHEVDDLRRRPGAGRLLGTTARGQPVKVESGTRRCAVTRQPATLRSAYASPTAPNKSPRPRGRRGRRPTQTPRS